MISRRAARSGFAGLQAAQQATSRSIQQHHHQQQQHRHLAASSNIIAAKKKAAEAAKAVAAQEAAGGGVSGGGSGLSSAATARAKAAKAAEAAKLARIAAVFAQDSKRHTARIARGELAELTNSQGINVNDAVQKLREVCWAKFDETVELAINLNLDPRKPNQSIKGVARLPHGVGKVVRVAVFAAGEDATAAKEAGADIVGAEELVAAIQGGDLNFDTVIATPELMTMVSKIGKVLGPRGLMPNPKMGTVTKDVVRAVKAAKAGAVQFRVEKKGIVQAGVGKLSFTNEMLLDNIRAFMIAVADAKPEGLKGQYFNGVHVSSTMNIGLPVDLPSCDPNSAKFMKTLAELKV